MASGTDHVAVLVVHGMGKQKQGETRQKLLAGLCRFTGQSAPKEDLTSPSVPLIVGGKPVRFYEVHWADVLKGELTRGSFLIEDFQATAWFPWFNVMRRRYPTRAYSVARLGWWCAVLPVIQLLLALGYDGFSFLARFRNGKYEGIARRRPRPPRWWDKIVKFLPARSNDYTHVDAMLDESVGDVMTYVNSAGNSFYRGEGEEVVPARFQSAYGEIVKLFYDQLVRASREGCSEIQIVAHSLGTVVTYHALSGFRLDALSRTDVADIQHALTKVTRLYTIGSPLEKVRFFWPALAGAASPWPRKPFRWDNFVSWFDPVAGVLRRFDEWGTAGNHHLLGGGFFRGHVIYEHSGVFLGVLARGISGTEITFTRTVKERCWDGAVLIGESLVAPVVITVIVAVGLLSLGLQAGILSYMVTKPLEWAGIDGSTFTDRLTWVIFVAVLVALYLIAPFRQASRAHAKTNVPAASGGT